jgi:hypothetical protein
MITFILLMVAIAAVAAIHYAVMTALERANVGVYAVSWVLSLFIFPINVCLTHIVFMGIADVFK